MPSPVTMPPLVFCRNTRPAPPVARITDAGEDRGEFSGRGRQHGRALRAGVVHDQVQAEMFIEPLDRGIMGRSLEQGVQDVEAGAVGGEPGPLDLHAAEGAHVDLAVGLAAPGTAPVLQLDQFGRGFADEILDHVLLAQPVAAVHGVIEMGFKRIVRLDDAGRAAFRRHRMAAHRQHFRNQRDGERGVGFGRRDGGSQPRAARADNEDVGFKNLHVGLRSTIGTAASP